MPATQRFPVTDKESEDMENDRLMCGGTSMQGWRLRQEVTYSLCACFPATVNGLQSISWRAKEVRDPPWLGYG